MSRQIERNESYLVKHSLSNEPLPDGSEGLAGTWIVGERTSDAREEPFHPELKAISPCIQEGPRVPQNHKSSPGAASVRQIQRDILKSGS